MHPVRLCRKVALGALLVSVSGCATQRVLIWPTHMDNDKQEHIYFVEQEQAADSRIKKCDIHPDNRVTCSVQYDLQAK
jgi:type IV pilus biogenesis protein CpaD/CtpE